MNTEAKVIKTPWSKTDILLGKISSLLAIYTAIFGVNYLLGSIGWSMFWTVITAIAVVMAVILMSTFVIAVYFPADDEEYREKKYPRWANITGDILYVIVSPAAAWM